MNLEITKLNDKKSALYEKALIGNSHKKKKRIYAKLTDEIEKGFATDGERLIINSKKNQTNQKRWFKSVEMFTSKNSRIH